MEPIEQGKAALIESIETDARAEEEKIIKESEVQAAEKRKYTNKKIESILNEAREKAQEQAEALKRQVISEVELEIKRRSLQVQQEVVLDIIERVQDRLVAAVGGENYRTILMNWIVDAAVGLDAESVCVNASESERSLIDEKLLLEVTERVQALIGRSITLTPAEGNPLDSQGVVLTSDDGRIAYNYQVKTRLLRKQRIVNRLIFDALFVNN